jgi:hypothetical protein
MCAIQGIKNAILAREGGRKALDGSCPIHAVYAEAAQM